MKNIFRPSLKKKLVFLLSVGYLVPVLVIIAMLRDFITEQYDHQVLDKAQLSLTETTNLATYYLSSMTEDSRRPSVEGDIQRAYDRYTESGQSAELYLVTESSLQRSYGGNSLFHSAALFFLEEDLPPSYVINEGALMEKAITGIYQELYDQFLTVSATLGNHITFFSYNNQVYMLRNMLNSSLQKYGLLVLQVNSDRMLGAFQGITGVCKVELLFDEEQVETELLSEPSELMTLRHEQNAEGHQIAVTLWVDIDQGQDVLENFQDEITQVMLLLFPAIAYMLFSFYRHVTRPLQTLMDAQTKVEQGELGHQVPNIPDSVEIRAVTKGFNAMSRSMKEQFEQSYQEQLALQDARMKTLQRQINPHFLNNTLEIINWECRIAGNDSASSMIEALSVMLSATMDREGKGKIPFAQELTYVEAYLFIQSTRMGARLQVQTHINEDSRDILVPRLAFQPLVENACEHGLMGQKQGLLVISTFLTKETLILEVKNTGHMSEETISRFQELLEWDSSTQGYVSDASNLGIRNVNQRVKMMYGEDFGLDVFNDNQDMTVVRLALPRTTVDSP